VSWVDYIPGFAGKLHSPLRFLAASIWNRFDFSDYDLVVGSASWYVTKGFKKKGRKTVEICYCHTPPRWLYGYLTSIEWQRYWLVRIYAWVVGYFMRQYDYGAAQRVDWFIANSQNTAKRIEKFYRREAKVIYPPVELPKVGQVKREDYYLAASRIVGGKGLELAVRVADRLNLRLKIAGEPAGYRQEQKRLEGLSSGRVEFLGKVDDKELARLYAGAKAFLALASDEDFGMTPVEAMLMGTPVVAYRGGGYVESVIEGKTGVFFEKQTVESLGKAIKRLGKVGIKSEDCVRQAKKFSKERFKREIKGFVLQKAKSN
jgi:glycosyltransferase involved in cell wall biosynthesis